MNRILGWFAVLVLAMCSATWAQGPETVVTDSLGRSVHIPVPVRRVVSLSASGVECIRIMERMDAGRNHGAHEDPKGTVSRSGETAKRRARLHAEFRSDRGTSPGRYSCMENKPRPGTGTAVGTFRDRRTEA